MIVYSPQNPYRGADEFRVIQRMANPLKKTLFGSLHEAVRLDSLFSFLTVQIVFTTDQRAYIRYLVNSCK